MGSVVQFPQQVPFIDGRNRIDYRWLRALEAFLQNLPDPDGSNGVTDGSESTYGPMTLFQGADAAKPGTAETGWIYFALDTGKIYRAQGSSWVLLSEELTGDVTKPAGSTVTSLANVFFSPGTYGGPTQTPVLTVDAKGRITDLWFEDVTPGAFTPSGPNGAVQFNQGGTLSGSSLVLYDDVTGSFSFSNPQPTRENLSPLFVKGDIFVRDSTESVRLPVGTNGQYLRANSAASTGLEWANDENIEVRFNFGDATPKPLGTVPANRVVRAVTITILTAFDDAAATLSIAGLMSAGDNLPSEEGTYTVYPGIQFGVNTAVELSISAGTSSQGSGLVTITLED